MGTTEAFDSQTTTHYIAVTTAASTPEQITDSGNHSCEQYLVTNEGPNNVFFNLTVTSTAVVAPTPGSPTQCYEILANSAATFNGPPQAFISAICKTGSANISIVGGEGL